ncbi:MAG: BrnT family toxin [Candidatus Latescibacteria bacterium]|nr:BrnT family toxin [Candidatus Latescibacterota bacterium]
MNIKGFLWNEGIVEKIFIKHNLSPEEVEEAFRDRPKFKKGPKGHRHGEQGYYCLGRSGAGRYIFVFFVLKRDHRVFIVSARDMTWVERRYYERR